MNGSVRGVSALLCLRDNQKVSWRVVLPSPTDVAVHRRDENVCASVFVCERQLVQRVEGGTVLTGEHGTPSMFSMFRVKC